MSDSYAGVTIAVRYQSGWVVGGWDKTLNVAVTHIPASDLDDVQTAGFANPKVTLPVRLASASDLGTLQAAVGSTKRTLVWYGASYTSVELLGVRNILLHPKSGKVQCDLDFMQVNG